jgi:hypothetical protein
MHIRLWSENLKKEISLKMWCKWEDIIKITHKEVDRLGVGWSHPVLDRIRWRALNKKINFQVRP